ncbi:acetyl-CoA C-acetyltransferase [Thalassovita taeanensis]|uniref:Acetyl-CoA C-acetyltransferase n=1 Tax=Thalassovita taeanensis TaxID=657014 RepID=A0A1H9H7J1_9RHOB|nr:acetyl-CoA C-acetyltransferase [Thalassovita taeanensis]SEQ58319.1 acetyl-CoA C-acetyltransferase [Thalassovita taeanensis]
MTDIIIYDALRTPRGKRMGSLAPISPIRLAAAPLAALATRYDFTAAPVEDVIMGCAVPVGEQGADIAKAAVVAAGYPQEVPASQVNRFCGSGLDAVCSAAGQIGSGQLELAIGSGIEHMSRVEMGSDRGAWASDPRETLITHYAPQGIGADLIATLNGMSRIDVDTYAAQSQARAAIAISEGRFDKSIIPVSDNAGLIALTKDEHPRPNTTVDTLAKLKPAFAAPGQSGFDQRAILRYPSVEYINHVHTGGNSSGIVDGAAAVLLGSPDVGARIGAEKRARLRSWAHIGSEPTIMLTGPAAATRLALKRAGMTIADVDLFEINEAFSSVVLFAMQELAIDPERVNVNGGAIALGHPLGATGAMLIGTVLDELERQNKTIGLVTLCVAGGMASAAVIERI